MNPIAKMLIDMAKFYDQQLDERQLEMYVGVLSQMPVEIVLQAGRDYVADSKNTRFPIPPHKILDRYRKEADPKDLARETALRIRHAVSKFGWPGGHQAKRYIGGTGWQVVERMGGWSHICENLGVELNESTFMAQCRDGVEAMVSLGRMGFDTEQPSIEQSKRGELTSAKDVLSNLLQAKKGPDVVS